MRPRTGAVAAAFAAVVLTLLPTQTAQTAHASPARTGSTVVLDGVTVHLRSRTRQVVTARYTSGWHARLTLWRLEGGRWTRELTARDGRTGYGGLVRGPRRQQGTGTTPLGTYGLISSFGTHARRSRWHVDYRRIRKGDFWVEDNGSRFYNRYRNQRQGGFRWRLPASAENGSERLSDYPTQYEYALSPPSTTSRCATAAPGSSCTSTAAVPPAAA